MKIYTKDGAWNCVTVTLRRCMTLTAFVCVLSLLSVKAENLKTSKSSALPAVQTQRAIRGTVTDKETNAPIPGVTVRIKNSTSVVSTDAAGKFTISAKTNDVLVASYLGYESSEISVGTSETVDFTLAKKTNDLDEVVVVGYGTQAKRDITGAITSVTSKQIMDRTPINIYEALQGQSPGVQVDQGDGKPGASSSVVIRGLGTLGGAGIGPLYIVDGAQGVSIDAINPNDVASIDILKDAASGAIYGARGANGVIIITTKRGQEGRSDINVNLVNSVGTISHRIATVNADERRLYERKLLATGTLPADSLNPGYNSDINAFDAVTRTAIKQDASVSFTGGSKNLKFLGSFQYVSDQSVILNSWSKQGRFRVNTDYNPIEKLTLTTNLSMQLRNGNNVLESQALNEAVDRNPTYALYLPDGSYMPTLNGRQNPVAWANLVINTAKKYQANIYNKATFAFTKNLSLTADATVGFDYGRNFMFRPAILVTSADYATDENTLNTNWLVNSYLNYSKDIGTNHVITALLGASAEKRTGSQYQQRGNTFITDQVLTLNAAQAYPTPTINAGDNFANSAIGAWARLGYNFKKRYQLNATARVDGSSRFGPKNRYGFFPSGGVAWNFSEEPFLAGTKNILTSGKLRGSYGVVGNDQISNYGSIQTYAFGTQFYNGVSGVVPSSTYGNPAISWESSKSLNIGTDLSFLNSRLGLSADYYVKTTQDLIYGAPLARETGLTTINVNTGSIRNKGWEFLLTGTPILKSNFSWNVSYNMSFNRGKVLSLLNHTPILQNGAAYTQEGHPLGDFYGWRQLSVYAYDQSNAYDANWNKLTPVFNGSTFTGYTLNGAPYTGTVNKMRSNGVVAVGGDAEFEDLDKNGIIDDKDRSILGNAQPDWIAGLTNNFNIQNKFNLSFTFYGSMGVSIYNGRDADASSYETQGGTPRPYIVYNAWNKQGDITDVPDAKQNAPYNSTRRAISRYIENGSWIRLRNVKFSYNMPVKLASYVGAKRLAFSVSGNNLLTWSNYTGFDPEISYTNPLSLGIDGASRVPRKKEFIFGLNVNF